MPTIYAWIKRSAPGRRRWLRQAHRKQYRPFKRAKEVSIEGRPAVINRRCRYGDWEGDTIVSRGRRSGLVTLVDARVAWCIDLLKDLTSLTTIRAASRLLANLPCSLRRSTTFDNGPEFAAYAKLTEWLKLAVYFAAPYGLATGLERKLQRPRAAVLSQRHRLQKSDSQRRQTH